MGIDSFYHLHNNQFKKKPFFQNNSNRKVICLDFDGVFVNPSIIKSKYLQEAGYNVKPEHSSRKECLNKGVPIKEYTMISSLVASDHIMDSPIEKNCINIINWIQNYLDIYIVTSRSELEIKPLLKFIIFHKIKINGVAYVGNDNKLNALSVLKPIIYIDDSLDKLLNLLVDDFTKVSGSISKCDLFLYSNNTNKSAIIGKNTPISIINGWLKIKNLIYNYELNVNKVVD
tara:strand:+ start:27119 stop:27808 length:690 start_codon:yes stop_codon:yes gene_type:complete